MYLFGDFGGDIKESWLLCVMRLHAFDWTSPEALLCAHKLVIRYKCDITPIDLDYHTSKRLTGGR